jgi:hypothetical protein
LLIARPTADLTPDPLISAESNEHQRLCWQLQIAFRRDGSEKPPANGRKLCASRENKRRAAREAILDPEWITRSRTDSICSPNPVHSREPPDRGMNEMK